MTSTMLIVSSTDGGISMRAEALETDMFKHIVYI